MKRLILFGACFLMLASMAKADYNLKKWRFDIVDSDLGEVIADANFTVTVYSSGGSSATTIYADEYATAKTNPMAYANDTSADAGLVSFYSAETTLDIQIESGVYNGVVKISGLTITDHRLIYPLAESVGNVSCGTFAATGNATFGVTGTGVDVTFWGDTAGDYAKWDQDGGTNGRLIFEDTELAFTQANVTYVLEGSTDALVLTATDHANAELTFGSTGTNGLNINILSKTANDDIIFDAGGKTLTVTDISTIWTDDTVAYTLAHSSNALYMSATDNANAKLLLGATGGTHGMDVQFNTITANDDVIFDAGAKTWTVTDISQVWTDDTIAYTWAHSTNAMSLSATDAANAKLILGATGGTHGMDAQFNTITAGEDVIFDAGAKTWTYDNVDVVHGDNDSITLGDGGDLVVVSDGTDTTFTSTGDVIFSMTGLEFKLGADGDAPDVYIYSEVTGDYAFFDEDNAQLDFVDYDAHFDDDARIEIGTGNDLILDSDGTYVPLKAAGAYIPVQTATKDHCYMVMPIAYVGATQIRVGAPGSDNICAGLTAGADEVGSTEGYAEVDDAADYLRFSFQLPETFIDTGTAADLVLEFDLHEQAGEECNIDVRIFEYGNTTPIITDTIVIADTTSRGWVGLNTLSSGIGADTDIDGDDHLLVELTCNADTDDFFIYGARLTYRVGLEVTQ